MSKKILVIVCIAFILLGTSCSLLNREKNELTREDEWQGIITIWDFPRWADEKGNKFYWLQQNIEEFERENPGVFIELRRLDWENGAFEVNSALLSNTYPDIVPNVVDYEHVLKGHVEPIDKFLTKEDYKDFYQISLDSVTFDGHIWGFPMFITTYAMFINLDIFNERDIEPPEAGIWTWDEFVDKLVKLTYKMGSNDTNELEIYGFHTFIKEGYYEPWGFLTSDGGTIFNDDLTEFTLCSPEGISGLTKLADINRKYKVTPPEFGDDDPYEAWSKFAEKQKVAVFPAGSWAVKVLNDKKKNGEGFNFDVAGYPIGDLGTQSIVCSGVGGYMILKQDNDVKKKLCADFLKKITSAEEQMELEHYGVFPSRKSAGNLYIDNPHMTKINEMLGFMMPIPNHPLWDKIEPLLQSEIKDAVKGEKTPFDALNDAKREIELLLD
ncbi:MAG TPA: sugar ABC transporter substrate-binding protein [Thermoanaerobacterales bacterium]|nr:sugar ABC transporter substrate-binding protein [Thermoanaerobacterales bacterium]